MAVFKEEYSESKENAEIASGATEQFLATQVNRDRYGSANSLIITSRDDNQLKISLDDNNVFSILQPNGSVIVKPEDGIFFDSIKLENLGADAVVASQITIRISRSKQVQ